MSRRYLRLPPIAFALLAIASANAIAGDRQAPDENNGLMVFPNVSVINAPGADEAVSTTGAAGMRVQKDRTTGQLRAPTAEEVQEFDALTPAAPEAPVEFSQRPDGSVVAKLNSAYLSYSVVSKDASGKLIERCVTGESAADHALHDATVEEEVGHER